MQGKVVYFREAFQILVREIDLAFMQVFDLFTQSRFADYCK